MKRNLFIFLFVPASVIGLSAYHLTRTFDAPDLVLAIILPAILMIGIFSFAIEKCSSDLSEAGAENIEKFPRVTKARTSLVGALAKKAN